MSTVSKSKILTMIFLSTFIRVVLCWEVLRVGVLEMGSGLQVGGFKHKKDLYILMGSCLSGTWSGLGS